MPHYRLSAPWANPGIYAELETLLRGEFQRAGFRFDQPFGPDQMRASIPSTLYRAANDSEVENIAGRRLPVNEALPKIASSFARPQLIVATPPSTTIDEYPVQIKAWLMEIAEATGFAVPGYTLAEWTDRYSLHTSLWKKRKLSRIRPNITIATTREYMPRTHMNVMAILPFVNSVDYYEPNRGAPIGHIRNFHTLEVS